MYRFLIIDDEPVVREGIAETIDWKHHGFELVGTARDGREGLEAIETLRPDVVLTDICMPFVDGLELAGAIADDYPATKTILLTGYDEFEYAQEAVKLKVSDFILKPITPEELRQVLSRLRDQLDAEAARRRQLDRLQEQLTESLPLLRERFLNRLIKGEASADEIDRRLSLLELSLPGPVYIAVLCNTDNAEEEDDIGRLAVERLVAEVAEDCGAGVSFSTPRDEVAVLLSAKSSEAALSRALECSEVIAERSSRELSRTVSIGTGDPVSSRERIRESYQHARIALEQRLLVGPNTIITAEQVRGGSEDTGPDVHADARDRFVRALRGGAADEARDALDQILSCFPPGRDDAAPCRVLVNRLLGDVLDVLESLGVDYHGVAGLGEDPFRALSRLDGPGDIRRWFLGLESSARELLARRRREHSEWKALEAEEYIRAHYMDPDISVQGICTALAISKSYLSSIFKAHTGMTVVEYLTSIRTEAAKGLLAGDTLKSYEVAARVGFKDAHYFSLTFKKQTGVSPTEYRELARQI